MRATDMVRSEADETSEYVLDMLAQLAPLAASCGDAGIAMVLHTIVAARTSSRPALAAGADTLVGDPAIGKGRKSSLQ